jgi:hypothetical protein
MTLLHLDLVAGAVRVDVGADGLDPPLMELGHLLRPRSANGLCVDLAEARPESGWSRLISGHRVIPLSWLALLRIARWPFTFPGSLPTTLKPIYTN